MVDGKWSVVGSYELLVFSNVAGIDAITKLAVGIAL